MTRFTGEFTIDPPLRPHHLNYLKRFSRTRRVKRNEEITEMIPDYWRHAVNLPLGEEGEYFVGLDGRDRIDSAVINYDLPPGYGKEPRQLIRQPGLWCDWEPSDDGVSLRWNNSDQFLHYLQWLKYLIEHFIKRWGYTINGTVCWHGEWSKDHGFIQVDNNIISVKLTSNM